MNDVKAKIIINVELTNTDIISKVDMICTELSLAPEQFISNAINKLLYDIQFVRDLRNYSRVSKQY